MKQQQLSIATFNMQGTQQRDQEEPPSNRFNEIQYRYLWITRDKNT